MPLISAQCPICEAIVTVDPNLDAALCDNCSNAFVVKNAVNKYNSSFAVAQMIYNALETTVGGKDFEVHAGVLTKYHGESPYVKIPDGILAIGEGAFKEQDVLTVEIPKSVEEIKNSAFFECNKLRKIIIPPTVKKIEKFAFCAEIGEIVFSDRKYNFDNGTEDVDILSSKNTLIEEQAFSEKVKKITVGSYNSISGEKIEKLTSYKKVEYIDGTDYTTIIYNTTTPCQIAYYSQYGYALPSKKLSSENFKTERQIAKRAVFPAIAISLFTLCIVYSTGLHMTSFTLFLSDITVMQFFAIPLIFFISTFAQGIVFGLMGITNFGVDCHKHIYAPATIASGIAGASPIIYMWSTRGYLFFSVMLFLLSILLMIWLAFGGITLAGKIFNNKL